MTETLWWRFRDWQLSLWPAARHKLGHVGLLRCTATTLYEGHEVRCELARPHRVVHDARPDSVIVFWWDNA